MPVPVGGTARPSSGVITVPVRGHDPRTFQTSTTSSARPFKTLSSLSPDLSVASVDRCCVSWGGFDMTGWCWVAGRGRVEAGRCNARLFPAGMTVCPGGVSGGSDLETELVDAGEGGDKLGGPRPAGSDAKTSLSGAAGDHRGGVEQAVAQAFGFGAGQLVVDSDEATPCQQVVGDEGGGEPGGVDGEGGGGAGW
jgi:hypothetical protein